MRLLTFVLYVLCACSPAFASEPPASLIQLVKTRLIDSGRYMNGCEPVKAGLFNDWPKGSVQKCTYEMTDKFSSDPPVPSRTFKLIAYLANADAYRLASWIDTACSRVAVAGSAREACFSVTVTAIRSQSGAQFPVAGQVMEDLSCSASTPSNCNITLSNGSKVSVISCPPGDRDACVVRAKKAGKGKPLGGTNGVKEQYMFRSGVTVRIKGCPNGENSDAKNSDPYATCRDDDALNRTDEHTSMKSGKARIISTTPAMLQRYTNRQDIRTSAFSDTDYFGSVEEGRAWLRIVEETYRAALSSADNPLIDAWVCNAYKWPRGCDP
ncbi:hypothetical protein HFN59_02275 [Rhizobium leguminosarum]|uniref:hypothetical protein n=1 Tax=Rhizobium leguminosarum TaxID=384 RepID=UPI001C9474FA|nr:hypothetical protein [Rhizobium leguminosarum]MBY5775950.1 hypothetical protein [Rhizobium leguminosarum]